MGLDGAHEPHEVLLLPLGVLGCQRAGVENLAHLVCAAVAQPRFLTYDRAATSTLPAQSSEGIARVKLYNQNSWFLHRVPGALVAKTGYTDAAQHTFVGAIERGGHRYGVVLLRAQRWPLDQWQQAAKLVDWLKNQAKVI